MSLLLFTSIIRVHREMCCYNLELQLQCQLDRARAANLIERVESERQGKHTIDRFNRSGLTAFTTIDGMTTVPDSSRIGLGAKSKNSEGAR
jgi:hypothetical protein